MACCMPASSIKQPRQLPRHVLPHFKAGASWAQGLDSCPHGKYSPAAGASAAVTSARLGRLVGVPGSAAAPGACSCARAAASLRPLLSRGLSEGLPAAPDRDGWLLSSRWRWRRLRARARWSATAPLAFPAVGKQHITSGYREGQVGDCVPGLCGLPLLLWYSLQSQGST